MRHWIPAPTIPEDRLALKMAAFKRDVRAVSPDLIPTIIRQASAGKSLRHSPRDWGSPVKNRMQLAVTLASLNDHPMLFGGVGRADFGQAVRD